MEAKNEQATAAIAIAATRESRSGAKKMSLQAEQYTQAIAMSSAELGAVIKIPTERISKHVGNALAHDLQAKQERDEAQREFTANIAYYYEVKQRLLNPGYRADVDGGRSRTPDDNQKCFGAPDWVSFNANCAAYSLQHADRKLKEFAKKNGLLSDDGDEIDDFEPDDNPPARRRQNNDPTPQKRYEFIATAAMDIANRNPEGEVEKQILAAAEHEPAPLMPIPPDVFTEVLGFITKISSSVTDEDVRSEARRLIGKMLLHRPVPEATKVLAEATEEEARKRNKRLEKKNGGNLGSEKYNPPPPTSEHVQRFDTTEQEDFTGEGESVSANQPDAAGAGTTVAAAENAPTKKSPEADANAGLQKSAASVKVTRCPPAYESENEGSCERMLPDAPDYIPPAATKFGYTLNEDGKWEYVGKSDAVA